MRPRVAAYRRLVGGGLLLILGIGVALLPWRPTGAQPPSQDEFEERLAEGGAGPEAIPQVSSEFVEKLIQAHEDMAIREAEVEARQAQLEAAEGRLEDAERVHAGEDGTQALVKLRQAELIAAKVGLQRARRLVARLEPRLHEPFAPVRGIPVGEVEEIVKKALEGIKRD